MLVATEDELSEAVALRLIYEAHPHVNDIISLGRKGNTYLRRKLPDLRRAARRMPVVLLTDLDLGTCAPAPTAEWLGRGPREQGLLLRVAVREIESWLLADRAGIATFLSVTQARITREPEKLPDPEGYLLQLASLGPRAIRMDLCPAPSARSRQGIGYNRRMCDFVRNKWSPSEAAGLSDSLARARTQIADMGRAR